MTNCLSICSRVSILHRVKISIFTIKSDVTVVTVLRYCVYSDIVGYMRFIHPWRDYVRRVLLRNPVSTCYCVKWLAFSVGRLPLPVTWLERPLVDSIDHVIMSASGGRDGDERGRSGGIKGRGKRRMRRANNPVTELAGRYLTDAVDRLRDMYIVAAQWPSSTRTL